MMIEGVDFITRCDTVDVFVRGGHLQGETGMEMMTRFHSVQ